MYMTANRVQEPKKHFVKKGDKELPVRELTLPYWVRLDLSGRTRAFVDAPRTFASSAFRPMFEKQEKFHEFFGRDEKTGIYNKQFAYVTNMDNKTCLWATNERADGEISAKSMMCKKLQVPTAQTPQGGKAPASTK